MYIPQFRDIKNPNRIRWGTYDDPDLSLIETGGTPEVDTLEVAKIIGDIVDPLHIIQDSGNYVFFDMGTAQSSGWFECRIRLSQINKELYLQISDASNNYICRAIFEADGNIDFEGTALDGDIQTYVADTWYHIRIDWERNNTCTLYLNGVAISTVTGNNTADADYICRFATDSTDCEYYLDDYVVSQINNPNHLNGLAFIQNQNNLLVRDEEVLIDLNDSDKRFFWIDVDGTDLKAYSTIGPYDNVKTEETFAMGGSYTLESVESNKFGDNLYFGATNSNGDLIQLKYVDGAWDSVANITGADNITCLGIWNQAGNFRWVYAQYDSTGPSTSSKCVDWSGTITHSNTYSQAADTTDQFFHGVNYSGQFYFAVYDSTDGWIMMRYYDAAGVDDTDTLPSGLTVPSTWDITAQYSFYNGEDYVLFTNDAFYLSLNGATFVYYPGNEVAYAFLRKKDGYDDIISYIVWDIYAWSGRIGGVIERIQVWGSPAYCGWEEWVITGNMVFRIEYINYLINQGELTREVMKPPYIVFYSQNEPFINQYMLLYKETLKSGVSPLPFDYKVLNGTKKFGIIEWVEDEWTADDTNTTFQRVDLASGHYDVLKVTSASGAGSIYRTLTSAESGTFEGYIQFFSDDSTFLLCEGTTTLVNVTYLGNNFIRIYHAATYTDVYVVQLSIVHVRVDFDCSTDKQSVYINGNLEVDDLAFYNSNTATVINRIYLSTTRACSFYVDALWWSPDGGEIGDNQKYFGLTQCYEGKVEKTTNDFIQYQYFLVSGVKKDYEKKVAASYTTQTLPYVIKSLLDTYADSIWYGRGTNANVLEFENGLFEWTNADDSSCVSKWFKDKTLYNSYTSKYDIFKNVLLQDDGSGTGICDISLSVEGFTVISLWMASRDPADPYILKIIETSTEIGQIAIRSNYIQWYDGSWNNLVAAVTLYMYHITLVFSPTDDDVDIYINGTYNSTQSLENNITTAPNKIQFVTYSASTNDGYACQVYMGASLEAAMNTLCSISPLLTTTFTKSFRTDLSDAFKWAAQTGGYIASFRGDDQLYLGPFTPSGQDLDEDSSEYGFLERKAEQFNEKYSLIRIYGGYVNGVKLVSVVIGEPNFGYWQDTFSNITNQTELDNLAAEINSKKNVEINALDLNLTGIDYLVPGQSSNITIARRNITDVEYYNIKNKYNLNTNLQECYFTDSFWIPSPSRSSDSNTNRILQNEQDIAAIETRIGDKTYLENIIEDTTPQLGGDLDCNGHVITLSSGETISGDGTNVIVQSGSNILLRCGGSSTNVWNIQVGLNYCYQDIAMSNNKFYGCRTSGGTHIDMFGLNTSDDLIIGASSTFDDIYVKAPDYYYNEAIINHTTASAANVWIGSSLGEMVRSTSSREFKTNIDDLVKKIDSSKIYDLRPRTFNSLCMIDDPDELHIGLIAEEVEEIIPELVEHEKPVYAGKIKQWYKMDKELRLLLNRETVGKPININYPLLGVLLLAEIKKLNNRIMILEKELGF